MSKLSYTAPRKLRLLLAPLVLLVLLAIIYGLVSWRLAGWVGGEAITRSQLATRMAIVQFIYDRQFAHDPSYDPSFARRFQRDILEQLAEERILLTVTDGLATAAELNDYAVNYLEWIRMGYFQDDEQQLSQALSELGLTPDDLHSYFQHNLLLTRLRERELENVTIEEQEAVEYYQQNRSRFDRPEMVKVSHIVVASQAEAEQLQAELVSGRDFAALALEHSLDEETAAIGGSLRWFERGEMHPAFEQVAFQLQPGETSGLVQTNEGWHIIKMESRQEAAPREYEEVRNLAHSLALEAKKDQAWDQYRRLLRGKQMILLLVR
ncbi:MAG: peptidylprolyl isomerase [Bacillota bacterium]